MLHHLLGRPLTKTADHRFGFCREQFAVAVSDFLLPWAICSCYDEFWIVSTVFVFAVNVCSLLGVILICCSEFYFLALNFILPWQLWATVKARFEDKSISCNWGDEELSKSYGSELQHYLDLKNSMKASLDVFSNSLLCTTMHCVTEKAKSRKRL